MGVVAAYISMLAVDGTDFLVEKVAGLSLCSSPESVNRLLCVMSQSRRPKYFVKGFWFRSVVGVIVLRDTAADVGIADIRGEG